MSLAIEELEQTYDRLAAAIDQAGPDKDRLLLAKLALVLAERIGDADVVDEAITIALRDLHIEPRPLHAAGD